MGCAKKELYLIYCLIWIFFSMSCAPNANKIESSSESQEDEELVDDVRAADITSDAWQYADSVVGILSEDEKAGMVFMPAVFARSDASTLRQIIEYAEDLKIGGLVLLKGDLQSAALIADTLKKLSVKNKSSAGFFMAVDAENGLRMRFPDAPDFPWSRDMGRISDDCLMYDFGSEIARECREIGINMVLGPVMDVVPGEASQGLMAKRSLGSNPERVADLAVAYARGLEDGNVVSVAKHFPGHGSSRSDSHRNLGEIPRLRKDLDSIDIYPFQRYVDEGLSGVMVGHLSAEALDPARRPAVLSPMIMGNILRDSIGFRGLILTDALTMEGAMGAKGYEAIMAGADIVLAPISTRKEISMLKEALRSGELPEAVLDDRCRRILFYKYLLNIGSSETRNDANIVDRVASGSIMIKDSIISALRRNRNNIPRMK